MTHLFEDATGGVEEGLVVVERGHVGLGEEIELAC